MKKKITIEIDEKLKNRYAKKLTKSKSNFTKRIIELIKEDLKV